MRIATVAALVLVPGLAFAADTDGDGIQDASDLYPCDAQRAALAFSPGEDQFAALLFEDQWPNLGDADFNDVVLAYNYRYELDGSGRVSRLIATFEPLALGGIFDNGFGLQLPVPATSVSQVTRAVAGGTPQVLLLQNDAQATLRISNDMREFFGGQADQINAIDGPSTKGQSVQVVVDFSPAVTLAVSSSPHDVFIFRSADPSHEIHRSSYAGTANMNSALFGTGADASSPSQKFIDRRGLPFVLDIPVLDRWPKEGTDIALVFPNVLTFAASAGSQAKDFYANGVDLAHAYVGSPAVTATPVAAQAAADTSCLPTTSCADLAATGRLNGAGVYTVVENGVSTDVFCDDGGWTLIAKINCYYDSLARSNMTYGDATHPLLQDLTTAPATDHKIFLNPIPTQFTEIRAGTPGQYGITSNISSPEIAADWNASMVGPGYNVPDEPYWLNSQPADPARQNSVLASNHYHSSYYYRYATFVFGHTVGQYMVMWGDWTKHNNVCGGFGYDDATASFKSFSRPTNFMIFVR